MGKLLLASLLAISTGWCATNTTRSKPVETKAQALARASKAISENRMDEAAAAYCRASAADLRDRELANQCRIFKRSVAKMLELFDGYSVDAITLISAGRFDEAADQFARIRFGPDKSLADDWINNKIPMLRRQASAAYANLDGATAAKKMSFLTAGNRFVAEGKLDEAAKQYCEAATIDPRDVDVAATCKSTQRDVNKQLERFDQYLADGISLAGQGKFDEALAEFRRIKYGPNKATADDWIKNKLPQLNAQTAQALNAQAQALRNPQAVQARSLVLPPLIETPRGSKADLLAGAAKTQGDGRLDEAARYYCAASNLDPHDADLAATCKATQRDVNKQLERFDQYLADGLALVNQGKYDEARPIFQRIKFGPIKATADDWLRNKLPALEKTKTDAQR